MTDMLKELLMTDIIHNLCERIRKLQSYIEEDARCPCCEDVAQCDDECTFESDSIENNCYDRYERMIMAREVLFGNEDKQMGW
jgi:hypothetical protein